MKKLFIYALAVLAAFSTGAACGRIEKADVPGEEEDLVIKIGTGSLKTRAGDDEELMHNLRAWMVKEGESTVKYFSGVTYPENDTAILSMGKVERGDYTLYIAANFVAFDDTYPVGSTIDENFTKFALEKFADYRPYASSGRMPISLIKQVSVAAGKNTISAELQHSCGRVTVTLKNRTEECPVGISSAALSERNPNKGYLFQQSDHSSPSGTTYNSFAPMESPQLIEAGADAVLLSQYLYESCNNTAQLQLTLKGNLYKDGATLSGSTFSGTVEKTVNVTTALTYTDEYAAVQPLKNICRGDDVKIVVYVFYNPELSALEFEVEPWDTEHSETTFD